MHRLFGAFFFLLICAIGQSAHADTITFDDLATIPGGDHGVEEYDGFYFYLFLNAGRPSPFPNDNTAFITSGYKPFEYGVQYPYSIIFNKEPVNLDTAPSFHSVSGQPFTLNSLLISAFSPIPIYGVLQGVVVDETTTSAASNGLLTLNWSNIDGILFPGGDSFNTIDIDTIVINEPTSSTATPEPSTVIFVGSGVLGLIAVARRKRGARFSSRCSAGN
jgi:hypothetical protein